MSRPPHGARLAHWCGCARVWQSGFPTAAQSGVTPATATRAGRSPAAATTMTPAPRPTRPLAPGARVASLPSSHSLPHAKLIRPCGEQAEQGGAGRGLQGPAEVRRQAHHLRQEVPPPFNSHGIVDIDRVRCARARARVRVCVCCMQLTGSCAEQVPHDQHQRDVRRPYRLVLLLPVARPWYGHPPLCCSRDRDRKRERRGGGERAHCRGAPSRVHTRR